MKRTIIAITLLMCTLVLSVPVLAWAAPALVSTKAPSTQVGAPAASVQAVPVVPDGVYVIRAGVRTASALEVANSSTKRGAKAQISTYTHKPNQRWRLTWLGDGTYKITNVNSGRVLGVAGGKATSKTKVTQQAWKGSVAQKWRISKRADGRFTITSALSAILVLSIKDGAKADGTQVRIFTANGTKAQQWKLSRVKKTLSNGYYRFANKNSSKLLGVKGAKKSNQANVVQQSILSSGDKALSQVWQLKYNANTGYYTLRNVRSQYMLSVKNGTDADGANVRQFTANGGTAQMWALAKNKDGSYTLRSATGGRCLSVKNGSKNNGANVRLFKTNGIAQRWMPEKLSTARMNELRGIVGMKSAVQLSITLDDIVKWNWEGSINSYTRQYAGTKAKLRQYLDPAKGSVYQHADLRKTTTTTAAQLDAFIESKLKGNPKAAKSTMRKTGQYFIDAAKKYNLNPDYLVAHAGLESAWGTSDLALGYAYNGKDKVDGKKYKKGTYYNFYGIGAYDSGPLAGGRAMAIKSGWNSPKVAIYGAAEWIAKYYVYAPSYPQYTLYGMKWDYLRSNSIKDRGWHQYATGIAWSNSIGNIMQEIYAKTGTGGSVSFVVPQYKK